ncbi:DUF3592 domain-containing protein [Streptomyces oceani]|uniref:DUF3592 domain-containing protein n=1 Tax=Streptomyces oceani TaxID=1075402 RepID=A0A1E7JXF4_9ACTN|nr:DUF3592 domain-containing protein [Streptomyces oceani]OEU96334.1 hypothetical protein AN216_20960 [Streptomyces oceani]
MWVLWLFLLTSPVIIGVGFREVVNQRRLLRGGVRTNGLVVRHRASYSQGTPSYFAVVSFHDAKGERHEFEASFSGVRGLPVGGPAPVLYLPGDPKGGQLDLTSKRRGSVLLIFGVGIAWLVIPAGLLLGNG